MSNPNYPQFYPPPPTNGAASFVPQPQPQPGTNPYEQPYMPPPPATAPAPSTVNQAQYPAYGSVTAPSTNHMAPPAQPMTSYNPSYPLYDQPPQASSVPGVASMNGASAFNTNLGGHMPSAYPPPPVEPTASSSMQTPFTSYPSQHGATFPGPPAMGPPPQTSIFAGGMGMPPPPMSSTTAPVSPSRFGPPVLPGAARSPNAERVSTEQPSDRRSNARIDPAHVPRPQYNPEPVTFETLQSGKRVPPPAADDFMAIDNGNCNPRFMRSTMYTVPATNHIRNECAIPFACVCTPFADPGPGEECVPAIEFGPDGPVRCTRCKAYVNPFVRWVENGAKWSCNLCGQVNEVEQAYYCSLDGSGQRRDRSIRPELSKGSIDIVVGAEYCVRPLQEPIYVFAIDVSDSALQSGFTHACLRSIRQSLETLPGGALARVGIFTFNSHVNFYSVSTDLTAEDPVKLNLTEIDDPFCALPPDDWLLSVATASQAINLLIDSIPLIATYHTSTYAAPVAAIMAAVDGLRETGGRVFIMSCSRPSIGYGRLPNRDTAARSVKDEWLKYAPLKVMGQNTKSADEKQSIEQYERLIEQALERQVYVEAFLYSPDSRFLDVAAFAYICKQTGGQVHYMTGALASPTNDCQTCLIAEITKAISSIRANEAVMKIRCGTGLRLDGYISAGMIRTSGEVDLVGVQNTTTITCLLSNEGKMTNQSECYVQFAVLYTTPDKRRIVRTHNLMLGVDSAPPNIFKDADTDACTTVFLHQVIDMQMTQGPADAKTMLETALVKLLLQYRELCSPKSLKSQLILPEPLKLLLLYCLGILKHPMLLGHFDHESKSRVNEPISPDERAYSVHKLCMTPVAEVIKQLYPRLYSVGLEFEHDEGRPELLGEMVRYKLPRPLSSSSEILDSEGMFILDDGRYIYLYVGRNFSSQTLENWFNISQSDRPTSIAFSEDEHAQRIQSIVQQLRSGWSTVPPIKCVWPDVGYGLFALRLVEDSLRGVHSYVDYLCEIHSRIQEKLK